MARAADGRRGSWDRAEAPAAPRAAPELAWNRGDVGPWLFLGAALALSGCAAGPRLAMPRSFFEEAPAGGAERTGLDRSTQPNGALLTGPVRAQVAKRMPRHDAGVQRRLAQAIVAEARLAGIDPLLVLAVIHVESSFEPRARSSAGAVGLMQLQAPTMRSEVARSRLRSTDRRDPVVNVQAGVRYLSRLLDSFGDLDLALMAYNAGPGRIQRLLDRGRSPDRYRGYPRKVRAELARLQRLMGVDGSGGGPVLAEALPAPVPVPDRDGDDRPVRGPR